jgi:protein SCO1
MVKQLVLAVSLIVLVVVMSWTAMHWMSPSEQEITGPQLLPPGGEFTVMTIDGPLSLSDLRGEVVVLYFGYAYCPDVCPTDLSVMRAALNALEPGEQAKVRGLFVSIDPDRDTPDSLRQFAGYFHERIIGATHTIDELKRITSQYAAGFMIDPHEPGTNYTVSHTASTYVIDPQGQLRESLPHASDPAAVTTAVRRYLPKK